MAAIYNTRPVYSSRPSQVAHLPRSCPLSPPPSQPFQFKLLGLCFLLRLSPFYKSHAILHSLKASLFLILPKTPKSLFFFEFPRSRKRRELTMGNSDLSPGDGFESDDAGMVNNISIEVMVAAVIFLFMVVVVVFFLYLYAKNYWGSSISVRRRSQLIFAASDAAIPSRGLDASVLRSLPVTIYSRSDFKDGLECSVCLCELSDGEKARLLPKCNHGFHLQCIDMWFHSHSTCPLCRCAVGSNTVAVAVAVDGGDDEAPPPTSGGAGDAESQPESPAYPTNVLFWGNQDQVNSRSSSNSTRNLVITLPNRTAGGFPSPSSPLPSSRFPLENIKSPSEEVRSPGASKLRSLRRLWSRGKKPSDSSCSSPMGGDIEQGFGFSNGEGSSNIPKTPTIS